MDCKKKVKIALITYWFYPDTIVSARKFRNIHQHLAGYPDLQLDIFTGSFNREYSISGACPSNGSRCVSSAGRPDARRGDAGDAERIVEESASASRLDSLASDKLRVRDHYSDRLLDHFPVDLTNVKYIKLYKNSFEKNIFAEKNAFSHLLNRTIFLGAAERRFGMEILRQKQLESYDIFYLSLGPFSSLLKTAYRLKKRHPEKKILIEYRDEWVDGAVHYAARHHLIHPYRRWKSYFRRLTDYLSHRNSNRLEKKVLPACDGIVVISREMIKHFIERIPKLAPEKFIYLPNGISDKEIVELRRFRREKKPPRGKTLRILYAGNLFGTQDIRPFLNTLDELLEAGIVARDDFEVEVLGKFNPTGERWPDRLKELVRCRGSVPRNMVYREYFTNDVLLFIIGDWPKSEITMTGKIFELIESGQPILALLPMNKNGCARRLLEKTNAACIADINNRESIEKALLSLLEQKRKNGQIHTERRQMDWFYRQYHYKNICRRLVDGLMGERVNGLTHPLIDPST